NRDAASARVSQQYLTQWTTLSTAAVNKRSNLEDWHGAWVQALQEGERGLLEPNEVVQPENEVQQQVPDIRVRQYFLRTDAGKKREVQGLVRRLPRRDVRGRRRPADGAGGGRRGAAQAAVGGRLRAVRAPPAGGATARRHLRRAD